MTTASFKILVIDADLEVLSTTEAALKAEGFIVFTSSVSREAIALAKQELPQMVLVDLLMPELDGIDICIELRADETLADTLIVFHTERNEDYSQIAAFNAGADDYIIKPVKARVLVSRLKALLKRHVGYSDSSVKKEVSGLTIDRERYVIFKDGDEIILPRKEFELLALLATSPRKVFTRKEISQLIWGYEIFSKNRTIDVHIRKLREKLGERYIKTIKGIGYSLEV
ncbi:MAG: two-component system response regulatory protein involved in phosphate regulation [Bacteroidetes bacterium]|nr:two-component system response regulatory protein involved in phosphate regulation [Bacteroidota bacterium]